MHLPVRCKLLKASLFCKETSAVHKMAVFQCPACSSASCDWLFCNPTHICRLCTSWAKHACHTTMTGVNVCCLAAGAKHQVSVMQPTYDILMLGRYWLRFVAAVWFELPAYAWRAGHRRQAASWSLSLLGYWIATGLMWRFNQPATLWILIIPFFVTSLALMFGNW